MSAQDINPVIDVLFDRVRSDKTDEETKVAFEAGLALLRVALLDLSRIADALEWLANIQDYRRAREDR